MLKLRIYSSTKSIEVYAKNMIHEEDLRNTILYFQTLELI
jgi:hypothetical protein